MGSSIKLNHRLYNDVLYSIMDEKDSLDYIKNVSKDDVPKSIWKEHGKTTEDWARYAHENNLWYPTTVYRNDLPYAYISNGSEYVEVYFLDERMFEYIYMAYKKIDAEKLFLTKIYVRSYGNKVDKPLADLEKDINIVFSQKGGLNVRERTFLREERLKVLEENKEAAHPVNVSQNWKKKPKYGEYEELLDYESIIKPGDLLRGIDTSLLNPPTDENSNLENEKKDNHWQLPPGWKKN